MDILPAERVMGEEGLLASPDGVRLAVRLPWYRSLPLSTVSIDALSIDGRPVPLADVSFELGEEAWPLTGLADLTDRFWFVLDSAFLRLPDGVVETGGTHEVALTISIYPPYIPGLRRANSQTETLRLA